MTAPALMARCMRAGPRAQRTFRDQRTGTVAGEIEGNTMTNITTAASDRTARPSEWGSTASRLSAFILVAAFLGGCASLPPGSNYPKTVTSALAEPEQTRLGRQVADAARKHPGTSAFRMLAVGVDGFLARVQMINAAERTLRRQ